ncbi:MAG: dipicolinate synthase subunit B [Firmicutes bacterium]|nr:dipicolinate synthase subunit B [Bacillota bacterium]
MAGRLEGRRIGFASAASHCTLERAIAAIAGLTAEGAEVFPILNPQIVGMTTRFGSGEHWMEAMESATGHRPWTQIPEVEPIGPRQLLDALVVAPCTGSTLSKLANAQTDTTVCMAAKAVMRGHRPVCLAVATNDGLGLNARNLATLLAYRDIYFVPFGQDAPFVKPNSLEADFDRIADTVVEALAGRQLQPMLLQRVAAPWQAAAVAASGGAV